MIDARVTIAHGLPDRGPPGPLIVMMRTGRSAVRMRRAALECALPAARRQAIVIGSAGGPSRSKALR